MNRVQNRLAFAVTLLLLTLALSIPAAVIVLEKDIPSHEALSVSPPPEDSAPLAESVPEQPETEYQTIWLPKSEVCRGDLILVNNEHPYQFPEEEELVSVYANKSGSYSVKDQTVLLREEAMGPLNRMLDDFHAETLENYLMVISGYRTQEHQQTLLDQRTQQEGAQEASGWVAAPGGSEHHTGLVLDFALYDGAKDQMLDYTGEGDYAWLGENCIDYGFIIRYEEEKSDITGIEYEPWHFRYVGAPHAALMREKGLCLEEYVEYLKEFPFSGEHLKTRQGDTDYEIYYVPAEETDTQIPVPEGDTYRISGNNVDGFIVTCAA